MMRSLSFGFLLIFSWSLGAEPVVFQGRVDLGRTLSSFESTPPVPGTLYLLSGAAAAVRILSETPFSAEVEFVQGEWNGEADLVAHRAILRFEGAAWADVVVTRKPRQGFESLVYPYRKFQVAAIPMAGGFRVVAVPLLF